jgi:hypothetical protein
MPLPEIIKNTEMYLLGDIFIRNFYSVFDYENKEVGLALNKNSIG